MKIFYSGKSGGEVIPEILLSDHDPDIMFTFHDYHEGKLTSRMKRYLVKYKKWRYKNAKNKQGKPA